MFQNRKITFIGPGVMAEAMIAGLIRESVAPADSLWVSGPSVRRGRELAERYHVRSLTDNVAAVDESDVVVFSIKPQSLGLVLQDLHGNIPPKALVLSIIAGASIDKIVTGLRHNNVVRSMPNTPARIGKGITVWTAAPNVSDDQHEMARRILGALGEQVFVDDEKFLDMATALSGTGPAYVFLFMEAMVDAGVHLGFPRRIAEKLVVETMRGSVEYYLRGSDDGEIPIHLASMRNQVTSPGGTTASALYFLEKAGFRTAISRAIWAAYERSRELGKDARSQSPEPTH